MQNSDNPRRLRAGLINPSSTRVQVLFFFVDPKTVGVTKGVMLSNKTVAQCVTYGVIGRAISPAFKTVRPTLRVSVRGEGK